MHDCGITLWVGVNNAIMFIPGESCYTVWKLYHIPLTSCNWQVVVYKISAGGTDYTDEKKLRMYINGEKFSGHFSKPMDLLSNCYSHKLY